MSFAGFKIHDSLTITTLELQFVSNDILLISHALYYKLSMQDSM